MESIDLVLFQAIKDLNEDVKDETAKKIVAAVHGIYEAKSKELATKGDLLELKMSVKQDLNDFKISVIEALHQSEEKFSRAIYQSEEKFSQAIHQPEEKQSDRFRYVYEKMADNHKSMINWLVATSIGVGALIVAAIKLLPS